MRSRVRCENTAEQLVLKFYGSAEEFSLALLGRPDVILDIPVGDYIFYPDSNGVKVRHVYVNDVDKYVVRGYSDRMLDGKYLPKDLSDIASRLMHNMKLHGLNNLMEFF